jgi:protein-disulfide isomerase-like protein with CxxC motif
MDNALLNNELPDDAVEMVRAIRDRHYEEMKHMTREEKRAHIAARTAKAVADFEARMANAKPDYERFPFIPKR